MQTKDTQIVQKAAEYTTNLILSRSANSPADATSTVREIAEVSAVATIEALREAGVLPKLAPECVHRRTIRAVLKALGVTISDNTEVTAIDFKLKDPERGVVLTLTYVGEDGQSMIANFTVKLHHDGILWSSPK